MDGVRCGKGVLLILLLCFSQAKRRDLCDLVQIFCVFLRIGIVCGFGAGMPDSFGCISLGALQDKIMP
jgi:hypothetical protein